MPNFFINVKEKGAKKAEKNIKGLNGALGGLASKAALAAGGFFGASMLLSGMKQAIDLAGQQEAAEKALETALGGTSQALLNQASALQQVSVFGDEAIIQQQAFLGSLKFSEDQIKNIIPVAMDLAAATGMTLESAVRNTAKTFSGLAGELGELVPQLRGLTKEQMMAGDAVKVMGDLFGGQASAQTETITGKLTMFKNVLGDTAEAFGELLIPPLTFVVDALGSLAKGVEFVLDGFKDLIEPKEFKLITGADLKLQNFKETLASLSAVELYQAGLAMEEFSAKTKLEEENLIALNNAIMNNNLLMGIANTEITKMPVAYEKFNVAMKKVEESQISIADATKLSSKEREKDLASTVAGNNTALGVMRSQIQAKFATMIAGLLERVIGTKGLFGLALAPIAAAGASQLFNKLVPSFATGGDFITNGPQMIMVGDNASQRERVQITPLGADPMSGGGSGSSVTVNVSGNVMSKDFVEGELADQIKNAIRRGTDFGLS